MVCRPIGKLAVVPSNGVLVVTVSVPSIKSLAETEPSSTLLFSLEVAMTVIVAFSKVICGGAISTTLIVCS